MIAIIMSTYNGQKYISKQIQSILAQSEKRFTLFIRDDGSTDDTLQLLQNYADMDDRINLVFDDDTSLNTNIGFGASFTKVIRHALSSSDYSYFAFCDQDDYWEPDKLAASIKALESGGKAPALCACNYYICDDLLNIKSTFSDTDPIADVTFENLFFEGVFPGFTITINRPLAQAAFDNPNADSIYYHDKWVSLIAKGCGYDIHYITTPLAKYRRHEDAISSTDKGIVAKIKWRIDSVLNGDYCPKTHQMLLAFYHEYTTLLSDGTAQFLEIFTHGKKSQKLFFKKRLRRSMGGEIMLRMIILLGKI